MRYVLGPAFSYTRPAPTAAPSSPSGKTDPQISHVSLVGQVATFNVPKYDLTKSNRLMEGRLYLVKEGDPAIPAGADGYVASSFPFGHADTSGLQSGGNVPITLPAVETGAFHAQYVLGLDQ